MKVLILHGGTSPERDVSLTTGRAVAEALRERKHVVELLDPWSDDVGEGGRGAGRALRVLIDHVESFAPDVVFVALHGGAGEDGTIQAALELLGVPYTGSGVESSALAMDKVVSKELFVRRSIPTPEWVVVDAKSMEGDAANEKLCTAVEKLGYPVVAKPVRGGSTVGTSLVRDAGGLHEALLEALRWDDRALVERYVAGRELTVAVLDDRPLPVVEIEPLTGFYDYESKYTSGRSQYWVPAELSDAARDRVQSLAVEAYRLLRCSGVARVDFRFSPDETPYCLEANVVPGLTATSLVPKAAAAAGSSFPELVEQLCRSGIEAVRP